MSAASASNPVPAMMRAIVVNGGTGDADSLAVSTIACPAPGPGEILIRVSAAGVNRPDIAQRQGLYPPPPGASDIIGLEVAGTVAALGAGASRWAVGDAVCALLPGGGYAEYAVVDARHALPVPKGFDMIAAAALPETIFTVWTNLFERGRLKAGDTALIHGANSGIGSIAILMAKASGARVFATARGPEKTARAKALGADLAIDVMTEDFVAPVQAAGGVDVVLDIAGGSYFERNIAVLKPDGRLAQIAFLDGPSATIDFRTLLFKRLTITGSTLRGRDAEEKARLTREIETHVWPWLESGAVRPLIDRSFPLEQASDAHRLLESGAQFGKAVLTL